MTTAYILGFQGKKLDTNSVATMTKHFPGGGPQKDGLDPHFDFQKGQVYPGNNFKYHLIPFEAAFKAHTAAIMPYYGVADGPERRRSWIFLSIKTSSPDCFAINIIMTE